MLSSYDRRRQYLRAIGDSRKLVAAATSYLGQMKAIVHRHKLVVVVIN